MTSTDHSDRGRSALQSAERAADEVRKQALEDASDDRSAVRDAAARAAASIDVAETEIRQSLQELRDEVVAVAGADQPTGAPRRRRGRFWRRRAQDVRCDVCGRTAGDESLDRWEQIRGTVLCPSCQAAGWRVAERAGVPYRPRSA
jgi:hypothetical protein